MRKKIVAGNWKMNKSLSEAIELVNDIIDLEYDNNVQLIIIPPFLYTAEIVNNTDGTNIEVGAQNCAKFSNGAYTGEISASMISSVGATHVIIGHSERRQYFSETDTDLLIKVKEALRNNLTPIFCCGEVLDERNSNLHFDIIRNQIEEGLFELDVEQIKRCVVAYEPVWAIGTGVTATSNQAQEMHKFIRALFTEKYGDEIAQEIPILYGGSCKPENAKELFLSPDVDGGLIGGASLVAEDFVAIANSF